MHIAHGVREVAGFVLLTGDIGMHVAGGQQAIASFSGDAEALGLLFAPLIHSSAWEGGNGVRVRKLIPGGLLPIAGIEDTISGSVLAIKSRGNQFWGVLMDVSDRG